MQSRSNIESEIDFVKSIKTISQAYQEISVMRIQKIKAKVVGTRKFIEMLQIVFGDVKYSYKKYTDNLLKFGKKEKLTFTTKLPQNGKTIAVFISANNKLYGEIMGKVYAEFFKYIKNNACDIMIIGKLGKETFLEQVSKMNFYYYEIPDSSTEITDIKAIIHKLTNYQYVNIFHGKYDTIVLQSPVMSNISGNTALTQEASDTNVVRQDFLFEPSIHDLMNFFETQVFTALFKQTLYESDLSRHASRITSMEKALRNIEIKERILHMEQLREKNKYRNKKQLDILVGISIWKKY